MLALSRVSALCVLMLAGCSTLRPIVLPEQTTAPPAATGVLADLDRAHSSNWQMLLNDGPTALQWRLRAIDTATKSIDLQSFIWKLDKVGLAIQERIIAAADRGVDVRILIDDSFLAGQDNRVLALHRHQNIQYRVYNPYKRRADAILSRTLLNLSEFGRLDHRMHNKVMVVDNRVAIVGGRNLADEYFGFHPQTNFRDMELLLGGPIVQQISGSFDGYFNDHWSFPADRIAQVQVQPVSKSRIASRAADLATRFAPQTPEVLRAAWFDVARGAHRGGVRLYVDKPPAVRPDDPSDRPVQLAQVVSQFVRAARNEIVIVSAYLIPTPTVTDVLRHAVDRGVRVRLLTNSINSNNHLSAYAAYRGHVRELLSFGAEVSEVRIGAASRSRYILPPLERKELGLHAKYMIVDRRYVLVGSSNLDPRSLRINTEIGVMVDSRPLARDLLQLTELDFAPSNAWELRLSDDGELSWVGNDVTLASEPAVSAFQRLEEWFFAHLPIESEL